MNSEKPLRTGYRCAVGKRQHEYDGYDDKDNNIEDNANFGDGRRYESPISSLGFGTGDPNDAED